MKQIQFIVITFVLLLTILLISCKQEASKETKTPGKRSVDSIGASYSFDTTRYFKHKSGFYLSEAKDVFQLNSTAYDDSTGFWSIHY